VKEISAQDMAILGVSMNELEMQSQQKNGPLTNSCQRAIESG
jgi:hypothetical protein